MAIRFSITKLNIKLIEKKASKLKGDKSITLGNNGSIFQVKIKFYSPVFDKNVVDTTGCAYFAITSMLISQKILIKV